MHNHNTRKKHVLGLCLGLLFVVLCVVPVPSTAADYGLRTTATKGDLIKYETPLQTRIGKVVGAALSLTGIIFFLLAVYAGFLWMTARGDESQAKKARETIIMAVTGLVIILGAYAITQFIFEAVKPSTEQ